MTESNDPYILNETAALATTRAQLDSSRELKQWLAKSNCNHHYSKFIENGISFDLVPELDSNALRELGITKLGDRLRLELAINNLKAAKLANSISVEELYKVMNLQINQTIPESAIHRNNESATNGDANVSMESMTLTHQTESTTSSTSSVAAANNNQSTRDSTKTATFIFQDGATKRVNVTGCFNAQSIKRKVLKKMGIKSLETEYDTYIHSSSANSGNSNNNTNNFNYNGSNIDANESPSLNLLFDVELVTICYSPERLEKHRIILCPKNEYPTDVAIEVSKRILAKYERYSNNKLLSLENLSQYHIPERRKDANKRPTLRNFFGQRPPSELISSNLAEYFPDTHQRDLEATVRNSVRYSVRLSRRFNIPSGMGAGGSSGSTMSINNTRQSIVSSNTISTHLAPSILSNEVPRRMSARTIGAVMVNNITAIDEAVNYSNADAQSIFSKPPSVYSSTSGTQDSKSIISSNSNGRYYGPNSHHRISIATSFSESGANNNRYSRIELVSVDSDSDDQDDIISEYNDEDTFNSLGHISEDGPKHWLKGARIGAGSFGSVYLGMNPFSGELMAVKQIPLPSKNNAEEAKKLMSEQQHELTLLKSLNHENIVRYYGASTDDEYLNIFLEYVPGGSVQTMLQSYGPFEEPLIRNFIRQVLIGLSYLHGEDIIHRDIKGANILIDIKGTVKIGDFGISKKVSSLEEDESHSSAKKDGRRASLQGSVYWMAPEVVKQTAYTKKADIWSVGCLIVEMFTGKHPFPEFSQMQAIFKIGTHTTPSIPEWCTMEAKDFLDKAFELDYNNRPDAIQLLSNSFLNPLIMSKR
ncbi:hypothetical protein G9P44_003253 [Scheffersomyces stipitis]|nr:hypothetical protein G9P44_003253 [Scheffersomyces stipitis]